MWCVILLAGACGCEHSKVLKEMYLNNNGANWFYSTGWMSELPISKWERVTADNAGCVLNLNLYENNLTGTIPESLGQISTLQSLEMRRNRLSGTLPSSLSALSQLWYMSLAVNVLSGTIPDTFRKLSRLKVFTISYNLLTGTFPRFLSALPALNYIAIGGNNFTGTIDSHAFQRTPELSTLSLEMTGLSGPLPDMSSNSKLEKFEADLSNFDGPFPSLNCTSLQHIELDENRLTGTIPDWLQDCKGLAVLTLSLNLFEGAFPLLKSSTLIELNIGNNQLTGEILPLLSGLPNLQHFTAANNHFILSTSHQGVSITHPNLETLKINDNHFTAKVDAISLPPRDLQFITLNGNTLYCPLPSSTTRVRDSEILAIDRCVTDWRSVMLLAVPGIVGGLVWLAFLWLFRRKTLLRFLVKAGINQASLVLNLLALFSFLQLLKPSINIYCSRINSWPVCRRFFELPPRFDETGVATFADFVSRLGLPQNVEGAIYIFRGLCGAVGNSTCKYEGIPRECVFNGDSHVPYALGVREIIITLITLLLLQQVIATWLVILALRREQPLTSTQRHLSYPSFFAFLLLCSKVPRDSVKEDVVVGLGRRRLLLDFLQGIMLKGVLLALNVWVLNRIQQTGLSNIQVASAFFNMVNIFVPLVRATGRACSKRSAKKNENLYNGSLQSSLME